MLSALGGLGGVLLAVAVAIGYAAYASRPAIVPVRATTGAVACSPPSATTTAELRHGDVRDAGHRCTQV